MSRIILLLLVVLALISASSPSALWSCPPNETMEWHNSEKCEYYCGPDDGYIPTPYCSRQCVVPFCRCMDEYWRNEHRQCVRHEDC